MNNAMQFSYIEFGPHPFFFLVKSDEARKLECKAGKLNTQTVELQRSPFFKPRACENLDNV